MLGIDCPGCGMTRAFISISHGKFARAWHLNHASIVVYFFVAVQIPWHAIQIWKLRRNQRPMSWSLVYMTPVAVVVVLSIQLGLDTLSDAVKNHENETGRGRRFRI